MVRYGLTFWLKYRLLPLFFLYAIFVSGQGSPKEGICLKTMGQLNDIGKQILDIFHPDPEPTDEPAANNSPDWSILSTIVNIKNGTLEGTIMKSRKGRDFVGFRGIPYAQPPLGELRFKAPKPFNSWTGVRSAKTYANMCTQRSPGAQGKIVGDEDCLYLNVFTPKLPLNEVNASRTNYPVMIWFHGGGYMFGNAGEYGPKKLLDHDVVLVTVNYRVGPLGFLSTEDLVAPGNHAMKDQAQSIRWVNENIAAFGGDPNTVTLFGQSAGGASVHFHMISPLSKGLFHRGISQSGTALVPWALTRPGKARQKANKLGKLLDCPTNTSAALVECLRTKDAVDIIATDKAFLIFGDCPLIAFRPVIEPDHPGAFLIEEPAQSLKSGKMADIPWMTGVTANEGAMKVPDIYGSKTKGYVQLLDEKFMELAPMSLLYEDTCPKESKDDVTKRIREFYFGDKKIDESTRMTLVDLYTDAWFFIAADNAVKNHLEALSSPVYYYFLSYRGSFSFSKKFGDPERDYGVSHADDLPYLFDMSEGNIPDAPMTAEDEKVIDLMTGLWSNFAQSGNPTPERTTETPVKWKPVETSNLEYLHIENSKNLHMAANLWSDRANFWASIPYRDNIKLI